MVSRNAAYLTGNTYYTDLANKNMNDAMVTLDLAL